MGTPSTTRLIPTRRKAMSTPATLYRLAGVVRFTGLGGRPMSPASRQRLLELFRARAFAFGRFTLASGKESTYYVNSKKALFNSEAAALLGEAMYALTQDLDVQAVGGLEVGALPLATACV